MELNALWAMLDIMEADGWPADLLDRFGDEIEALGDRRRAAIAARTKELADFLREQEARRKEEREDLDWWWFLAFLLLIFGDEPEPAPATATTNENRRS